MSPDMFISEANSRWKSYISFSQVLAPLILAIALRLLYLRSGQYVAEHLIFALHFLTFTFVLTIVFWPVMVFIGLAPTPASFVAAAIFHGSLFVYLVLALRRVYGQSLFKSTIKAFGVYAGYFVAFLVVVAGALKIAIMLMTHAEN